MPQSATSARAPKQSRPRRRKTASPHTSKSASNAGPVSGRDGASANAAVTPAPPAPEVDSFAELALPQSLVDALIKRDLHKPFPIQTATIPDALAGRDVLGRGRTGSGKTLAFGLALLTRLEGARAESRRPRALVLVPTRELAQQVCDALQPYGRELGLRLTTVVGGASMGRQIDSLRRGVEVLVATPGRLTDLIERGACQLDDVRISVLDEADQMADMGFLPAVSALLDQVKPDGQRLLFSATLDGDVDTLIRRYLVDPVTHSVDPSSATIATMTHHVLVTTAADRQSVTTQVAARDGRTLMFARTKHGADRLAKQLGREGIRAAALHGGKTQSARARTLAAFRDGTLAALVATDVAARGIHVEAIDLVVNVDPPAEAKDYLHRSGRTARAGEAGAVVTLALPEQRRGVLRLLAKAGIQPENVRVTPGDDALVRITGARPPSGIPVGDLVPDTKPGGGQRRSGQQDRGGRQQGRQRGPERRSPGKRADSSRGRQSDADGRGGRRDRNASAGSHPRPGRDGSRRGGRPAAKKPRQ